MLTWARLTRVLVALFVCWSTLAMTVTGKSYAAAPEFLISAPSKNMCEIKVLFASRSAGDARATMFDLLSWANRKTNNWNKEFVIVGVDFVSYSSFHAIIPSCAGSNGFDQISAEVRAWFQSHCENRCDPQRVSIIKDDQLHFAASVTPGQFSSAISMYLSFRSKKELQNCLMRIDIRHAPRDSYARLFSAWKEYRLPIFDLLEANGDLYVLLVNHCNAKENLYSAMMEAMTRGGGNAPAFGAVDYHPNASAYLSWTSAR
jgi:hypothetical protein